MSNLPPRTSVVLAVNAGSGSLTMKQVDGLSLVSAHFSGGCSATAILNGQCVDTMMGLTPNEGMALAERSGLIALGLLLALMRNEDSAAASAAL